MPDRTAVVYFTKGGAARVYAQVIAETLTACGHAVDIFDLRDVRKPDLDGYQNVVFGTGVRIGMVYGRGKRFLRRTRFEGKRLAVFLASGVAVEDPDESRRKFLDPLLDKYGLQPVMCDAFPGNMPDDKGKLVDRTDPAVARQWAKELGSRLSLR